MHKVSGNLKVFLKYMKKFKACVFSGGKSHLLFYKIHTLHFNFVLLIISVLKGANISESLLLIIKFWVIDFYPFPNSNDVTSSSKTLLKIWDTPSGVCSCPV